MLAAQIGVRGSDFPGGPKNTRIFGVFSGRARENGVQKEVILLGSVKNVIFDEKNVIFRDFFKRGPT